MVEEYDNTERLMEMVEEYDNMKYLYCVQTLLILPLTLSTRQIEISSQSSPAHQSKHHNNKIFNGHRATDG